MIIGGEDGSLRRLLVLSRWGCGKTFGGGESCFIDLSDIR
jgi:NAD dependent epimerase/dehydratase family enzyme